MKAPLPPDETQRLAALRDYDVLDTLPEQAFDDLTMLAAHICQAPIALVSLIDEKRQWFKSKIGLSAAETSRDIAFCAHAILHRDEVLEVRDAEADPRFVDSTLVTEENLRFYAGAPLVTRDGHALGALCVMDRSPRKLTPEQLAALRALSRNVVAQLELRRQTRELTREFAERQAAEARRRQQFDQLADSERETSRLLAVAEQSRRVLLSVLEDEKHAGQSLRESNERFREIAENIREVFWITDPTMQSMLYVSPGYEKIWGRSCASLYAAPHQRVEAIHVEDRERVLAAIEAKRLRVGYDETYRILRPDGETRWIHDRAVLLRDPRGEVYRIIGIAEDITKHQKLEQQYRQAQKMEAIGTLAGGIAHDFNNVLAAMNGYTELAKMKLGDNPVVQDYLTAVMQAVHRATALVKQILTFSRQQEQPQRQSTRLGDVVAETLKLLRSSIPSTIEFSFTQAPDVAPVLADSSQIHQIMMNLCTNAWHAMRDQPGRLAINLENVEVDQSFAETHPRLRPGPYVHLSLGDTGKGMDAATIERIFEPFFTTKPPGEGTGLGLSVVHGIMESYDGVITVYSHPGAGTIFHLYFPAYHEHAVPALPAAKAAPQGEGARILYVDDEQPLAVLGQKTLEQLGYHVTITTKVAEALAWVREAPGRFDLVITDQTMPGMVGTEFAAQLLKIRPNLPIILTTGYSPYLTLDRVHNMGIRDLLIKPHTLHTLGHAVHAALAGKKPA